MNSNSKNSDFYHSIELFIVLLNNHGALQCDSVFNKTININIECITENSSDKCICIVDNVNGTKHRCTRAKKFGDLCGLHFKRKNTFKTIYNEDSISKTKTYTLSLTKRDKEEKSYHNSELDFINIEWNNICYKLDKTDGSVYFDNSDGWEFLDSIHNLDIPISVY